MDKDIIGGILIGLLFVVGYWLGGFEPRVVHNKIDESNCSDIIRYQDGSVVCEINMGVMK